MVGDTLTKCWRARVDSLKNTAVSAEIYAAYFLTTAITFSAHALDVPPMPKVTKRYTDQSPGPNSGPLISLQVPGMAQRIRQLVAELLSTC